MLTTAHINPKSPRADSWKKVFGDLPIILKGPIPIPAWSPDREVRLFYHLDIDAMMERDPKVIERLVAHTAQRFNLDPDEVWKSIDDPEHGAPILADDVSIISDTPWFL